MRACPGLVADLETMLDNVWRGLMTETSQAASFPSFQYLTRMSPGLCSTLHLSCQQVPLLSCGGEAGLMSSLEENIAKGVMSGNAFSLLPAPDGMVVKDIRELAACNAGTRGLVDWEPIPVPHCRHILSVPDVETESEVGDAVQPVTTMREDERVKVGLVMIIGGGVQEKAVGETVQLSNCTNTGLVLWLLLLSVKFGLAVQQPLFSLNCCL